MQITLFCPRCQRNECCVFFFLNFRNVEHEHQMSKCQMLERLGLPNIDNPLTYQTLRGGEVSGGHLSADCDLVSMMSIGEWLDYPPQAGSCCLGCRQKSKRAEG